MLECNARAPRSAPAFASAIVGGEKRPVGKGNSEVGAGDGAREGMGYGTVSRAEVITLSFDRIPEMDFGEGS